MALIFGVLSVVFSAAVSQSVNKVNWLPCQFIDEHVEKVNKINKSELYYQDIHRNARLQFGPPADNPVHSDLITFLVTGSKSKVDRSLRQYSTYGDKLQCKVRRYWLEGTERWPGLGATKNDSWFTCTLRHIEDRFVVTAFLRHSPTVPNLILPDLQQWIPVADKDIINTTAVMTMHSKAPSVKVELGIEQTLNCEFAIDHKAAHFTVEWHRRRKGQYSQLFSYSSRTRKVEGSGVSVKAIANGNVSLIIPNTNVTSEGTYVCSVHVPPLNGSLNIDLLIMEPPRVSLNVNSKVTLTEGELERVDCKAKDYYPLDVDIQFFKDSPTQGFELNVTHESHRTHHRDGTYTLLAYFLLKPTTQDSGSQYTCRVSHVALSGPILKSFTLTVLRKDLYLWYIPPLLAILGIVYFVWSRRQLVPKAPKGYSLLSGP